jgi:hypothetical protein
MVESLMTIGVCVGGIVFFVLLIGICLVGSVAGWWLMGKNKPPRQEYLHDTGGKLAYWTPSEASLLCVLGYDYKTKRFSAWDEGYYDEPAWHREYLYLTREGHYVLCTEDRERRGFWTYGGDDTAKEIAEDYAMELLTRKDVLERTNLGESLLKEKTGRDLAEERANATRKEKEARAEQERKGRETKEKKRRQKEERLVAQEAAVEI